MSTPAATAESAVPSLVRTLGVGDLTWLYLVAVVNIPIVSVAAAEGSGVLWLWALVILLFFIPQGIGVIELAERMPGEGGLYLWTKETFGDFHGFLCGWCYWLTNMFFVPTLLLYITGTTAYLGGSAAAGLGENRAFFFGLTFSLLWIAVYANIRGLTVGKWVNNIGGVGALLIGIALVVLAGVIISHRGSALHWRDLAPSHLSSLPFSTLGVLCLALVGLEIGPIMGDEIRHPRRTVPRGVLLGGVLCATIYFTATAALLIGVPQAQMKVVEGTLVAIDKMSAGLGLGWILVPLALLMAASIAGSTSAWVSGSARILFVTGIDRYLPKALGKVHSRYGSPHIALIMFGALASVILAMSFIGASVKEAYLTLLDLSVALQMVSYLYLFSTLLWAAFAGPEPVYFRRSVLKVASVAGALMSLAGLVMAFVPSRQIDSVWSFELKMMVTFALFLGLARGLFVFYSARKPVLVQVNS